jgi:hypothetical protein
VISQFSSYFAAKITSASVGYARTGELVCCLFFGSFPWTFSTAPVCNVRRAFGLACKKLNDAGQPDVVREVMIKRNIAAARRGECDAKRLRDAGLTGLRKPNHQIVGEGDSDGRGDLPQSRLNTLSSGTQRWSRLAGQNGGLAKVDSGFDYAANLSSFACVA